MNNIVKAIITGVVTALVIGLSPTILILYLYLEGKKLEDIAAFNYMLIGTVPIGVVVGILSFIWTIFILKKKED